MKVWSFGMPYSRTQLHYLLSWCNCTRQCRPFWVIVHIVDFAFVIGCYHIKNDWCISIYNFSEYSQEFIPSCSCIIQAYILLSPQQFLAVGVHLLTMILFPNRPSLLHMQFSLANYSFLFLGIRRIGNRFLLEPTDGRERRGNDSDHANYRDGNSSECVFSN